MWVGHEQSVRGKCTVVAGGRQTDRFWRLGRHRPQANELGNANKVRWLWLQRTDEIKAWSELPLHVEAQEEALFKTSITIIVGDGTWTKFWTDRWLDGQSVEDLAPHLAAVSVRAKRNKTVAQALINRAWIRDITGGMTIPVIASYLLLWDRLENAHL